MDLSRIPLLSLYFKGTFSTRTKTHYDALEVSPNATHNEIKSAYYQLTLLYHPDKNETEAAKKKFQEISDAYEVLSNHHARKQYDMRVKLNQTRRQSADAQFRSGKVNYKADVKYPTTGKAYDFDEWTRQHYTTTFEATLRRRRVYDAMVARRQAAPQSSLPFFTVIFTITLCSIVCNYIYVNYIDNNDVIIENNTEKENNK